MKLYLVRHGETAWNKAGRVQGHSDIPLNENGIYLAEETAKGLKDVPLDLAYTSPLCRAKQTAEIILKGRNVPIYEEPKILEMGFGTAEGLRCRGENPEPGSEDFNKFFTDTAHYKVPEGGESISQLSDRVDIFLKALYENQKLLNKSILITSHGAALTAMLNLIKGKNDIAKFWNNGVPRNCAVTEVEVKNGNPKIIYEGKIYY
ncbi:histidine phosphatase family protein [Clostridium sp. C105KSO13]|uniref:histidine phosphatase family protein n=1 Tax=Clostridium sp. C105KSO13 TaxID=1776045 RepID=UPI0007407532|nr:histidine phosphatase family protein [Clostridium sp. C105KSO13]CUX16843.1 Phosphoserine phosphatase 1 [Clostridium sp. C105KSO13]